MYFGDATVTGPAAIPSLGDPWIVSATAPASPVIGTGWYDTASGAASIYDGAKWIAISGATTTPLSVRAFAGVTVAGGVASVSGASINGGVVTRTSEGIYTFTCTGGVKNTDMVLVDCEGDRDYSLAFAGGTMTITFVNPNPIGRPLADPDSVHVRVFA